MLKKLFGVKSRIFSEVEYPNLIVFDIIIVGLNHVKPDLSILLNTKDVPYFGKLYCLSAITLRLVVKCNTAS